MRTTIVWAVLLTAGVLGIVGASGRKELPRHDAPAPAAHEAFIVHEWGTFTNFSGSDGIQFEFRPLVDQDLPPFVHSREKFLSHPLIKPFIKGEVVARQRMETPVTYFYTDRPRTLDVRVDFPHGLLTEFYPPVSEMMPPYSAGESRLSNSSLAWQVKVYPPAEVASSGGQADGPPALPQVTGDDHYGFARETDSAVVEVADRFGQRHAEKFLFYRGIGNFSLPLRLEALPGRHFQAINDGPESIEAVFMVMIDDEGLRFRQYPRLPAHTTLDMGVPDVLAAPDELGERMAEALVAAGLFEKEARAMIHTWQSSWFSEPGARLFYLVPRPLTDEIIPLRIAPAPDKIVRVLVGRMETLTPETAHRLTAVIANLGTCLSADASPLRSELDRLGRFAEPALAYLLTEASDAAARDAISRIGSSRR